jgi:serine/threonine protein kinase
MNADSKKLMGQNPVWLAPEVMQRKDYNEKIDIYSFGVILWEMLTRQDYFGEVIHHCGITSHTADSIVSSLMHTPWSTFYLTVSWQY